MYARTFTVTTHNGRKVAALTLATRDPAAQEKELAALRRDYPGHYIFTSTIDDEQNRGAANVAKAA